MVQECEFAQANTFPLIFAVKKNDIEQMMLLEQQVVDEHKIVGKDPFRSMARENLQRDTKRYKQKLVKTKFSNIMN